MKQREIKFRVWDGKRMHYGAECGVDTGVQRHFGDILVTKGWEVMQFTSLQDRQGKDIYEGDLIRNRSGRVCKVEWHQPTGSWDATPVSDKGDSLWFMCTNWGRHIEVIGNIYENPELLK